MTYSRLTTLAVCVLYPDRAVLLEFQSSLVVFSHVVVIIVGSANITLFMAGILN